MDISNRIPKKGFYVHYKHDPAGIPNNYMYEVVGIGRNSEDHTYTVLYRPLYENDWMKPADYQARPFDMFLENIEINGRMTPRFVFITDPKIITRLEKAKKEMY